MSDTLPFVLLCSLRLLLVLTVVAVDLFSPFRNWRVLGVCFLGILTTVCQLSELHIIVTAIIGIPFWMLLSYVLINKIQSDPRRLRALIRMEELGWEKERDALHARIAELEERLSHDA